MVHKARRTIRTHYEAVDPMDFYTSPSGIKVRLDSDSEDAALRMDGGQP